MSFKRGMTLDILYFVLFDNLISIYYFDFRFCVLDAQEASLVPDLENKYHYRHFKTKFDYYSTCQTFYESVVPS